MKERSLIIFTLLAQMAVGVLLAEEVVYAGLARWVGTDLADLLAGQILWWVVPLIGFSILASFFHLGRPTRAWRAFTNLRTSWLSREILFTILFAIMCGLFVSLQFLRPGFPVIHRIAAWIAILTGLVMIYCMARVYMLRTVPAWNNLYTPLSFICTAFLLGSLVVGLELALIYTGLPKYQSLLLIYQQLLQRHSLNWIGFSTLVLLGLEFLVILLGFVHLAAGSRAAANAVRKWIHPHKRIFALRLALTMIGAGLGGFLFYSSIFVSFEAWYWVLIGLFALGLTLAGETLGRFLFYEMRTGQEL